MDVSDRTMKKNVSFNNIEDTENSNTDIRFKWAIYKRKYLHVEFIIKILQLVFGSLCTIIYFYALNIFSNSYSNTLFPHVIFNTFIIITGVIVISYIFNHPIQDILVRIFDSLGAILYFITIVIFLMYMIAFIFPSSNNGINDEMLNGTDTMLNGTNTMVNGTDTMVNGTNTMLNGTDDEMLYETDYEIVYETDDKIINGTNCKDEECKKEITPNYNLLFPLFIFGSINVLLYTSDLILNIKRTIDEINYDDDYD